MIFRSGRLNSEMRKVVADVVAHKLKDPRIGDLVSITGMEVAKDLKTAKVYVSVYGDERSTEATMEALRSAAGFIRKELSAAFSELRTVPALEFRTDNSLGYGSRIDAILEEIKKGDAD